MCLLPVACCLSLLLVAACCFSIVDLWLLTAHGFELFAELVLWDNWLGLMEGNPR